MHSSHRSAVRGRPGVGVVLALLVAAALMWLYLWQSWQIQHLSAQLIDRRSQLRILEAQTEMLRFEVAQVLSLSRIEQWAKGRLGMIEPQIDYLVLPSLTVIKP